MLINLNRVSSLKCRAETSRGHHLSLVHLLASDPPPLESMQHDDAAVLSSSEDKVHCIQPIKKNTNSVMFRKDTFAKIYPNLEVVDLEKIS